MENRRPQRIEEAARHFVEALAESYEEFSANTVSARQLNAELTIGFFNAIMDNLRARAERPQSDRDVVREVVDQQQRQRDATRALMQESLGTQMEFLDFMFTYYRNYAQEAEEGSQTD